MLSIWHGVERLLSSFTSSEFRVDQLNRVFGCYVAWKLRHQTKVDGTWSLPIEIFPVLTNTDRYKGEWLSGNRTQMGQISPYDTQQASADLRHWKKKLQRMVPVHEYFTDFGQLFLWHWTSLRLVSKFVQAWKFRIKMRQHKNRHPSYAKQI